MFSNLRARWRARKYKNAVRIVVEAQHEAAISYLKKKWLELDNDPWVREQVLSIRLLQFLPHAHEHLHRHYLFLIMQAPDVANIIIASAIYQSNTHPRAVVTEALREVASLAQKHGSPSAPSTPRL